jgi:hypothetical protein
MRSGSGNRALMSRYLWLTLLISHVSWPHRVEVWQRAKAVMLDVIGKPLKQFEKSSDGIPLGYANKPDVEWKFFDYN